MKNENKDIDMFDVPTKLSDMQTLRALVLARVLAGCQMEIRFGVGFEMIVAWVINVTVRVLTLLALCLICPKVDTIFLI